MTVVADPTTSTHVNARVEGVFLRAETYALTARQVVHALAHHLARYGDTLAVTVVDPLAAIDAVLRFGRVPRRGGVRARGSACRARPPPCRSTTDHRRSDRVPDPRGLGSPAARRWVARERLGSEAASRRP